MPNLKKSQRPIDKIAREHYSWWGKSFVFIKKNQVKTWQAIFIIAFVAGACSALIWAVSINIQSYSSAATPAIVNRPTLNRQNNQLNDQVTSILPDISFLTPAQVKDLADQYGKKLKKTRQNSSAITETTNLNASLKKYKVPNSVQAELDNINSKSKTWTANFNSIFVKSDQDKKKLLGLKPDTRIQNLLKSAPQARSSGTLKKLVEKISGFMGKLIRTVSADPPVDSFGDASLPTSFDWRNVGGKNYITSIKDQANCGSCWAFATAATLEGNINAYFNNPAINQNLSEQDLVSCYLPGSCATGAYANQIEQIFSTYLPGTGITQETCMPYTASDESCSLKCSTWPSQIWKTDSSYHSITPTIDNIKSAVVNNGPVEVGMVIYADFPSYAGGIYANTTGDILGYHAVTIVGFGNENNTMPYWIVKNSWSTGWGEGGYFKIAMGNSMIDQWFVYAPGIPYYNTSYTKLCTDTDNDGYCYWGLGVKPTSGCPACNALFEDCNDSNSSLHNGCEATASTLTINLPIITGFKAMVSINGRVTTQYTAPISLRAGDTFTVTPSPVTGYNPVTSGICNLASPGVRAGVTYVCDIIYSTLTINLPSITGVKAMVSVNRGVATQYTAPIVLHIGDTFTVTPGPVTGYYPATFGNCSLGSPGANAGRQYVCTVHYDIFPWSETRPAGDNDKTWRALAMSADGSRLIAGVEMGTTNPLGRLYISSDFGSTWRETRPAGDGDKYWQGAAMSADGSRLIVGAGGPSLYISSDFGTTWRETRLAGDSWRDWYALASSVDGSHLIAGAGASGPGRLYISSDFGATWSETRPFGDSDKLWETVAMSADGSHLIAGVYFPYYNNGYLFISSDYGATWREIMPAGDPAVVESNTINWFGAAMSADGSRLIAGVAGWAPGRLYISSDYGATWRETRPAGDGDHHWFGMASSADGSRLLAGVSGGRLYFSSNYGATWRETRPAGDSNGWWRGVVSSADGSRFMVGNYTGRLHITPPPPPSLTVLSPNGGEKLFSGAATTVRWSYSGAPAQASISVAICNSSKVPILSVVSNLPNTGSYSFTIPTSIPSGSYYVLVVDFAVAPSQIMDYSNAPFTIAAAPSITVVSPNGGETYQVGNKVTVRWQPVGALSSTVLVEVRKGISPYIMIYSAAPNTGSYVWTVPSGLAGGSNWKIRVTDQTNRSIYDESNAPFTVQVLSSKQLNTLN